MRAACGAARASSPPRSPRGHRSPRGCRGSVRRDPLASPARRGRFSSCQLPHPPQPPPPPQLEPELQLDPPPSDDELSLDEGWGRGNTSSMKPKATLGSAASPITEASSSASFVTPPLL